MPKRPRRVVTGHDARGRSVVLMDGESPYGFFLEKAGGLQLTELWETRSSPADNSGAKDAADHERRIEPVEGGSVFRIIERRKAPAGFCTTIRATGRRRLSPGRTAYTAAARGPRTCCCR